jgi:DNA-binding transcriptional regulator YiaG
MEYTEFKQILKENSLTIKKFSELSGISYRTCNAWSMPNRKVSEWVESWLKLYTENQECKKYKESMKTIMNGLN